MKFPFYMKWETLRSMRTYKPGDKFCSLCRFESLAILKFNDTQSTCLNPKKEILTRCIHRRQLKFNHFEPP